MRNVRIYIYRGEGGVYTAELPEAQQIYDEMIKVLKDFGVASGNLLDLCCGNGRVSIYMDKKRFRAVHACSDKI